MDIRDYKVLQCWIKSLSPEQFQQYLDGVMQGEKLIMEEIAEISGMNQAAFADRLEDIIQRKINTLNWLEKK